MTDAVVGYIEEVIIHGTKGSRRVHARIDTGATTSSIDANLAEALGLGPVKREKVVRSSHGQHKRSYIEAEVELAGARLRADFSIAARTHMRCPVLIGRNILRGRFLVDSSRRTDTLP